MGSFCRIIDQFKHRPLFPQDVIAICDVIKVAADNGNQIPDKSWMLYLLELFNVQSIPAELNLICQFDNQHYFEAILQGINRYRFVKILPEIGHSYLRMLVMDKGKNCLSYILTEQETKGSEIFDLFLNTNFQYVGANQFTGIEWWNKTGNFLYPLRYHVEISQLMFGIRDANNNDPESITFIPHNALIPNNDESGAEYPLSFNNPMLKDGCIYYSTREGSCNNGIRYNC
ncbi:MAG: hypothetical protein M3530_05995 [Thermoproteota archaeon]|nr:hypothetical protein [Thermoproteota archaeon]